MGDLMRQREIGAKQRGHGADTYGDRLLHRLSAELQELRGRREIEGTRRAERRIFAKAVPGDEIRHLWQAHTERPEHRNRIRHDRRLRIFGELELVVRSIAHEPVEILAERLIDLGENVRSRPARIGERTAHSD
jgi:hypothetical protein